MKRLTWFYALIVFDVFFFFWIVAHFFVATSAWERLVDAVLAVLTAYFAQTTANDIKEAKIKRRVEQLKAESAPYDRI